MALFAVFADRRRGDGPAAVTGGAVRRRAGASAGMGLKRGADGAAGTADRPGGVPGGGGAAEG